MAPFVLNLDPRKVLDVERAMDVALPGHLHAKAPIDMACWDIAGQAAGLPISDLMGGGSRTPAPIASSVGAKTVEDTRDVMNRYRERGYVAHSVKIGGGVDLDIARIRDVEAHRGPNEVILYDVNRGWTRQQALRVMQATEDLRVMFEQPCETLDDIAAIRPLHSAPVSVDESLVTLQDATRIARDGLAEVFGIKLNRVGGLTKAARMRDVALAHGIDMFIMATGGSVLADAEALHLAATVPDANRLAVWACQDMLSKDIARGPGAAQQGRPSSSSRIAGPWRASRRGGPRRAGCDLRVGVSVHLLANLGQATCLAGIEDRPAIGSRHRYPRAAAGVLA